MLLEVLGVSASIVAATIQIGAEHGFKATPRARWFLYVAVVAELQKGLAGGFIVALAQEFARLLVKVVDGDARLVRDDGHVC